MTSSSLSIVTISEKNYSVVMRPDIVMDENAYEILAVHWSGILHSFCE